MGPGEESPPAPVHAASAAAGDSRQGAAANRRSSVFFETAEAERARDPKLLLRLEETLDKWGARSAVCMSCH